MSRIQEFFFYEIYIKKLRQKVNQEMNGPFYTGDERHEGRWFVFLNLCLRLNGKSGYLHFNFM